MSGENWTYNKGHNIVYLLAESDVRKALEEKEIIYLTLCKRRTRCKCKRGEKPTILGKFQGTS